jgi:hypothetical protein
MAGKVVQAEAHQKCRTNATFLMVGGAVMQCEPKRAEVAQAAGAWMGGFSPVAQCRLRRVGTPVLGARSGQSAGPANESKANSWCSREPGVPTRLKRHWAT